MGRKARKMDSTSIQVRLRKNTFQLGSAVAASAGWVAVVFLLHTVGISLEAQQPVPSNPTNAALATFQAFVNGEVPVKEAVVYRKITRADGTLVNQEWWRFGYQENTWYVQRLEPDKANPSKLVPLWDHEVFGASITHVWTVSDKTVNVAAKQSATGSVPDRHGAFPRSLMIEALSLGLPRRLDVPTIGDAPIGWDGLEFQTVVGSKRDEKGAVLATSNLAGKLSLGDNRLPASAEYPGVDAFPAGSVTCEYNSDTEGVPAVFIVRNSGTEFRYEFISLELGSNDLNGTDGYVPSLFADMKLERLITLYTNDKPYSVIHGKIRPAFGAQKIVGEHRSRIGLIILVTLAAASAIILALWYRRSEQERKTKQQQQP